MMLTPAQLTTIDQHLREINLLSNEELILELMDHYSFVIENPQNPILKRLASSE